MVGRGLIHRERSALHSVIVINYSDKKKTLEITIHLCLGNRERVQKLR
jgi:hypothetical protein